MRISKANLEAVVFRLNELTSNPTEFITDGKINVGNYTLDWAYGGVQLQRVESTGGSVSTMFGGGYCSKRELYEKIQAHISGIRYQQENPK